MSYTRTRRLENDHESMKKLRLASPFIDFTAYVEPHERYLVTFRCKGLVWKNGAPAFSVYHQVEIYLRSEYPTQQPRLRWLTPIFHPNILGSDHRHNPGKVCFGKWTPSMFLGDLCIKLAEMIQYKNYGTVSPLNMEAAVWANENVHRLPVDKRDLLKYGHDIERDKRIENEMGIQILD